MEKKIENVPVYIHKPILNGTKEKITYIANDGKVFDDEQKCKHYEAKLKDIEDGQAQFEKLNCDGYYDIITDIMGWIFEAYDVSSIKLFKWKATKDLNKQNLAHKYLIAKGCSSFSKSLFDDETFNEGEEILIASWSEGESGDYPSWYTKSITYKEVIEIIEINIKNIKKFLK